MRGAAVAGLLVLAAADGAGAQATMLANAGGAPLAPFVAVRPMPVGFRVRVRLTPDTGRSLAGDVLLGPEERVGTLEGSDNDTLLVRARGALVRIALSRVQAVDVSQGRYPRLQSIVFGAIGGALAGASIGRASGQRCPTSAASASCLDRGEGMRGGLVYGAASGVAFGLLLSRWERWRTVATPAS